MTTYSLDSYVSMWCKYVNLWIEKGAGTADAYKKKVETPLYAYVSGPTPN